MRIVDPEVMMRIGPLEGSSEMDDLAKEARVRLERVAEILQTK